MMKIAGSKFLRRFVLAFSRRIDIPVRSTACILVLATDSGADGEVLVVEELRNCQYPAGDYHN